MDHTDDDVESTRADETTMRFGVGTETRVLVNATMWLPPGLLGVATIALLVSGDTGGAAGFGVFALLVGTFAFVITQSARSASVTLNADTLVVGSTLRRRVVVPLTDVANVGLVHVAPSTGANLLQMGGWRPYVWTTRGACVPLIGVAYSDSPAGFAALRETFGERGPWRAVAASREARMCIAIHARILQLQGPEGALAANDGLPNTTGASRQDAYWSPDPAIGIALRHAD